MSTILVDTVTGKTTATSVTMPTTTKIGATAIVSASAGSATIIGEGGTTTTNIQQGLAKAWTTFNGTGTIATTDSHNIASLTDTATGVYRTNFTNDMGNAEHADAFAYREGTGASGTDINRVINYNRVDQAAGFTSLTTQTDGVTPLDVARIAVMTFGDLA